MCVMALALFNILVRVNVDMIIWRKWRAGQIRCRVMLDNQLSRDASIVKPPPSVITCRVSEVDITDLANDTGTVGQMKGSRQVD